nr:hypothetical protein [Streptococcus agalactiae]
MLKLDEKKIRKGKPIGLPYPGSKKKISKKIVEIIKQNFGIDKTNIRRFRGRRCNYCGMYAKWFRSSLQ